MKITSVGCLITNGEQYLACHSTGNAFYDLPKGTQEEDETPIEACLRELREETGLVAPPHKLKDLGIFSYIKYKKDLHIFLWRTVELPNLQELYCSSYFRHPKSNKELPEVDGYRFVSFEDADQYMSKSMAKVIHEIRKNHL
ncbi:NUDIX hydrolase [Paenibacillus silviterrae]|uniref:NUDIX hydrolase n=1 Tax=Paenibacillus silviterrae TaxID=3242194 RepID=UPI0025437C2D|nr:NUDIX hydrolase [Paenibacillus chinjuensis]